MNSCYACSYSEFLLKRNPQFLLYLKLTQNSQCATLVCARNQKSCCGDIYNIYNAMFEVFHLSSGTKVRQSRMSNSSAFCNCLKVILKNIAAQIRAHTGSLRSGAAKGNTNVDIIVDMQL